MDEQNTDAAALSATTLTVLEAILRKQGPFRPAEVRPADVSQTVRYLAGALSAADAQRVEQGLLAYRSARDRLRSVRASLREMQALSWAEVAERARRSDEAAPIARAWLDLASERIVAAPQARIWWRTRDWTAIRQELATGLQEAQVAWMALLAFIEQWKLEQSIPRVALAKGGRQNASQLVGGPIEGAQIRAEIDADGTLRVALILPESAEQPDASLLGKRAHLSLILHGAVWPIASQTIAGVVTEFVIPAVGTVLDLPDGEAPSELIQIAIGEADPSLPPERLPLLAEVLDRRGKPAPGSPAAIEIDSLPRWEAGQLTLQISLPPETRDAFPKHHLELELLLSAQASQHLGTWPVSLWGEDPQTLTAACPGSPDTVVPFTSCLRARLIERPGE